jgi:hypothetical protein
VKKRLWTQDEVDTLKAATVRGVTPGTVQVLCEQFKRTPAQVTSKITELRLRGEIADSRPPTGKRSPGR